MRIGWGVMTGLGMAALLVAAAPARAQAGTASGSSGSSTYGESSKGKSTAGSSQDTSTMGQYGSTKGTHAGMTQNEVTGKVDKFDQAKKELTLRLPVSDDTQVTKDGKRATLSDIKEGDQVRASFSGSGDQLKVNRIDVMSAGGAGKPGELPSTGATGTESGSSTDTGSPGTRGGY